MSEFKNYGLTAGYLIFGITLVILALIDLDPSSLDAKTLNGFRIGCAGGLIIFGVLIAREEPLQAAVFFVTAFTFAAIVLGGVTAASVALPVLGAAYLLLAAVILLNRTPGRVLLTVLMIVVGFNMILRYAIAPDGDGVSLGSGICCIVAAALSMYLGLAYADPEQRLPLR